MQLRFNQLLAGMRAAQRFLDANTDILGSLNAEGGRRDFDQVAARLADLAKAQDAHGTGAAGELSNERRLAIALRRDHMRPIVRIARWKAPAAAQLSAVSLPPIRSNSTELANRANGMADAVEPYRQLLHDGGLPVDFVEQLRAAAAGLVEAIGRKKDHQVGRVGATENISSEVADARAQLGVMDSLVRKQVNEAEPKLADWKKIVRDNRAALRSVAKQIAGDGTPASPAGRPATPEVPAAAQAA